MIERRLKALYCIVVKNEGHIPYNAIRSAKLILGARNDEGDVITLPSCIPKNTELIIRLVEKYKKQEEK